MKQLIFIGLGGGIGSIGRYGMQLFIRKLAVMTFPAGTMIVNISGCFAIGILYALADRNPAITLEWRLFLITGICGGYTTFSTFSYESIGLLRQGNYLYFILYVTASILLGLLATAAGISLVK
jgi:CrcB protein